MEILTTQVYKYNTFESENGRAFKRVGGENKYPESGYGYCIVNYQKSESMPRKLSG